MTDQIWVGKTAMKWWASSINSGRSDARQLSARLRRADSAIAVLAEPQVFALSQDLNITSAVRIALIAKTLARVKHHTEAQLPELLGRNGVMSQQRFRRLISSPFTDMDIAMRRALSMTDGQSNVAYLAADLLNWNETTRGRWCMKYHSSSFAEETKFEEDLTQ